MNLETKRYKVIADYPHSDHGIGDIFIATDHPNIFRSTINGGEVGNPDEFPSIFRPLAWYEERTAEEMPVYVKYKGEVRKVVAYRDGKVMLKGNTMFTSLSLYTPATKDEYTEFIKNM